MYCGSFPVCIDFSLQCIPEVEITNNNKLHSLVWDKVSQDISMQHIHIPFDAISCKDVNCKNEYHHM